MEDTGFSAHVLNYTFMRYGHLVPSRTNGHVLVFDDDTTKLVQFKRRNFYAAFAFMKHYPKARRMQRIFGVSKFAFTTAIRPTIYVLSTHINYLDWQLRLWEYNHVEHFERAVTLTVDCFPVRVCASKNRWVRRLCKSGKYKEYVLKAELVTMLGCRSQKFRSPHEIVHCTN